MVRVPDPERHKREFAALPATDRRAVLRAVNRGRAVESRKLAGHAVVVARRQQGLWRWLWIVGPAIGVTQLHAGPQAALASGLLGLVTMGLLAAFWWSRARRAEQANYAMTSDAKRRR